MFPQVGADGLDTLRVELDPDGAECAALLDPARPIVLARRREDSVSRLPWPRGSTKSGPCCPTARCTTCCSSVRRARRRHVRQRERGARPHGYRSGRDAARDGRRCVPPPRPANRPAGRRFGDARGRRNARPIRLGRGTAPLELELPAALPEPVLAVGGHLKLAVALAWDRRIVVSPHIGDMGTLRSEQVFEQVVADLQRLYDVTARHWLCDAHPGYTTTRWVQSNGRPYSTVLHHHAHASALVTEHGVSDPAIVFAWDGVGYGADGTLWGGETFTGRPGAWSVPRACVRSGCREVTRQADLRGAAPRHSHGKLASNARSQSPIRSCARHGTAG